MGKTLPEKPPSDYIMFPFIGLLVFFVFMPFYTNIFYTWHDYFLFTDFLHVCKSISKMLQGRIAQGRFLSGFTWIPLNYLQLKIQDIRLIAVLIKLLQFINASLFCFFLYKVYVKISRNWKFAILVTILTINLTGFLLYFVTNYTVIINSFIFVPLISVYLVADHRKSIIRNKKTFFFAALLCCASLSFYNWHAFVVPSFAVFALLFAPVTPEEKYKTAINILTIFIIACIVYFAYTKILIISLQLLPPNESHAFKFGFQNIIKGFSFHFHYVLNFWFLNKGLFEEFYTIPQIVLILAIILFIRQEFILSKHKFSVLAFRFGIMVCAIGFCQSYFIIHYPHFVRIHLGLALMCLFFCIWLVQKALKKIDTLGGFSISVAVSVLAIFVVITAGHFNQNHYYINPAQNEFAFMKGALASLKEGLVDVVRIKKGPYLWMQHDTYGSTVFSRFGFAPFAIRGFASHAYSDLHGLPSTISSINNSVLNLQIDENKQYFDISVKNRENKRGIILTLDGARAQPITKTAERGKGVPLPSDLEKVALTPAREQATLVQEGYCGYNIIKLDQDFVAVRQDLGRLDFLNGHLADIKAWPYLISGNTAVTVHEEILKRGGYTSQYKIFTYKGGVVAANICLGEVDPTNDLIGVRELPPSLFVGCTSEEVLAKVDARSDK